MGLRPATFTPRPPVQQRDDPTDQRNSAKHEECGLHQRSSESANAIPVNAAQIAIPTRPTVTENPL